MMRPHVIAIVLALAIACPVAANAEDQRGSAAPAAKQPGRAHSFELSFGGELLTSQALGTSNATMTSNPSGSVFNYFSVTGTRATTPAFRGRIGYNITRMFTVEGGLVAGRGNVQGSVTSDAENAAAVTVSERMTQYFIDVSLLAHLPQAAFSNGAGVPFLEGGAGYLRQMHEGNIATNTGQIYHFGGGITYMFSKRPGKLTGLGIRADAQIYIPRNGYSFSGSQSVFAGVGAALLLAF
jgi:hypothetical protein